MPGPFLLWDADETKQDQAYRRFLLPVFAFAFARRLQEVEGAQQESLRGAAIRGG